MPGLLDDYNQSRLYADRMGKYGDQLLDPYSTQNQYNLRNMSSQFNAGMPNYFEIAASQGRGGSIAAMQNLAARRQSGLLTNANFGAMMNDNQKTALGYFGQQGQTSTGLLNMDYQDKWKQAELDEQKRQFDESQGGFWGDLLNVGLGIAGSFAGGIGGGIGKGLSKKWGG